MAKIERLTYSLVEERPWFREGVTPGWVIIREGETGQARPAVALTDGDGETVLEYTGEWRDVTITAD